LRSLGDHERPARPATEAASRPTSRYTLNRVQIGCARVFSTADQYADPHYAAREMTVPALDRQSGVPVRVYGVVPKMSLTPGGVWRGACAVGEDTTDILSRLLGLSETEIDGLYA